MSTAIFEDEIGFILVQGTKNLLNVLISILYL